MIGKFKKSTWIIIVIQLCFLVLWNCNIFSPATDITLDLNQAWDMQLTELTVEEGRIDFNIEENAHISNVVVPVGTIPFGAYEYTVTYKSSLLGYPTAIATTGSVRLESNNNSAGVVSEPLVLNDAVNVLTGRFYINRLANIDDANFIINFEGNGTLEVESIVMKESLIYRFTHLLQSIFLLILANIVFYIFFGSNRNLVRSHKSILIVLGIALIASLPMMTNFIALTSGHDTRFHMMRIIGLAENILDGQFPSRLPDNLLNGYGYPTSIYYGDFFLYLPALLYACMIPLRTSYQVYVIVVNVATALIAYYSFRKISKDENISLVATMLYTLSAYRLSNVMLRTAVGEYSAMTFLPLLVVGMYCIYMSEKPKWKDWLPLSLGMSGIILTHMLTVQMVLIFLVIAVLFLLKATFKKDRFFAFIKAVLLTVGLTAWFIVPFLTPSSVPIKVFSEAVYEPQAHGLYPAQLFGLFTFGEGNSALDTTSGEMPLSLGFPLVLAFVGILVFYFNRDKFKADRIKLIHLMFFLTGLSMIFTLRIFPWDSMQNLFGVAVAGFLTKVQFSWRYLTIAVALLIFTTVLVLSIVKEKSVKIYNYTLLTLVASSIISVGFFYSDSAFRVEEKSFLYAQHADTTYIMGEEYLPIDTVITPYFVSEVLTDNELVIVEDYTTLNGDNIITLSNTSDEVSIVTLPIINYDNYYAYDQDQNEIPIVFGENYRIALEIAPGFEGSICIKYEPPFFWRMAEWMSLITLIILIVYICPRFNKKSIQNDYNEVSQ